ncbi:uncharacterized protein LOC134470644 isoform X5 [Cavia porcellus]|uniref:uncharacterized protein LOC134470644 isoform X5 n=1 Tax=Cavia porcellus TaxID=10141 RepID=UPI002FE34748
MPRGGGAPAAGIPAVQRKWQEAPRRRWRNNKKTRNPRKNGPGNRHFSSLFGSGSGVRCQEPTPSQHHLQPRVWSTDRHQQNFSPLGIRELPGARPRGDGEGGPATVIIIHLEFASCCPRTTSIPSGQSGHTQGHTQCHSPFQQQ